MFVEKDDEPELLERYDIVYFPAFVWTDGAGKELTRSVQPAGVDEVMEELQGALDVAVLSED